MSSKIENITAGMELFNLAFPAIAGVIVTLKSGKTVNVQELLDETEEIAEGKIQEANDFLNRSEPQPQPE